MTLRDRAEAYAAAFPDRPALQVVHERGLEVLCGTWLGGQNYRATASLYGSYPPGYLARIAALFPDAEPARTLHVFSGSLPAGPYVRVDVNPDRQPDHVCNVVDLPRVFLPGRFRLTMADPPYSSADAKKYGVPMVDRRRALASIAQVTAVGGFLVWLDCVWPMFSKRQWRTVGRICLVRSTNHRVRLISIFERQ
jgi:hypothetical protein